MGCNTPDDAASRAYYRQQAIAELTRAGFVRNYYERWEDCYVDYLQQYCEPVPGGLIAGPWYSLYDDYYTMPSIELDGVVYLIRYPRTYRIGVPYGFGAHIYGIYLPYGNVYDYRTSPGGRSYWIRHRDWAFGWGYTADRWNLRYESNRVIFDGYNSGWSRRTYVPTPGRTDYWRTRISGSSNSNPRYNPTYRDIVRPRNSGGQRTDGPISSGGSRTRSIRDRVTPSGPSGVTPPVRRYDGLDHYRDRTSDAIRDRQNSDVDRYRRRDPVGRRGTNGDSYGTPSRYNRSYDRPSTRERSTGGSGGGGLRSSGTPGSVRSPIVIPSAPSTPPAPIARPSWRDRVIGGSGGSSTGLGSGGGISRSPIGGGTSGGGYGGRGGGYSFGGGGSGSGSSGSTGGRSGYGSSGGYGSSRSGGSGGGGRR